MGTISENLQTISTGINNIKTNLGLQPTDSLENIVTKSGQASFPTGTLNITENGTVDVSNYASAEVNVSGGGGGLKSEKDINFFDYDGTLIDSWSLSELQSKTELPPFPTYHEKLIAQEWTYTLQELKQENKKMDVGILYETKSGDTEIDITVTPVTGLMVPVNINGEKDWGDGTINSNATHTYTNYGSYTIKCKGTALPTGNSSYSGLFGNTKTLETSYLCTEIRLSNKITTISNYCFEWLNSLKYITIPKQVTTLGSYSFSQCKTLRAIILPKSITQLNTATFDGCNALNKVIVGNLITSIASNVFSSCYSLFKIDFSTAKSIITLSSTSSFSSLTHIAKIIIPDELYDTWITKSNWSSLSKYLYKVSEIS